MNATGMWLGMWIFLVIVLLFVVLIVMGIIGPGSKLSSSLPESPMDILKKRYAHGEIDEAKYERRKKELED